MGDIYKSFYTAPIPDGAKIKGQTVTWTDKRGQKKTGKLSGTDRVLIETAKYIARYRDERGKLKKVATNCKSKDAAQHFLRQKEMEVERIRAGLMTREELTRTTHNAESIGTHLDAFDQSRHAKTTTKRQISDSRKKVDSAFAFLGIKYLDDATADKIDRFIVHRKNNGIATQTINNDLSALRSFFTWCVETDRLEKSPMKNIKQLSRSSGNKTDHRAFTEEEITLFFQAVRERRGKGTDTRRERELIYFTMLGTGLRSSELASITISQVTPSHMLSWISVSNFQIHIHSTNFD